MLAFTVGNSNGFVVNRLSSNKTPATFKNTVKRTHVQTAIQTGEGASASEPGRPLQRASDLSTRRQRKGHAMVTTGTED